jgi:hypothetical protein
LAEWLGGPTWRSGLAERPGGVGLVGDHGGGRSLEWWERFPAFPTSAVLMECGNRVGAGRVTGAGTLRPTTVNGPYRAGAIWGSKPRPSAWAGRTSPTGSLRGESLLLGNAPSDSTAVLPRLCQRPRNPSPSLSPPSPRRRATWRSDLADRPGGPTWRTDLADRPGGATWRNGVGRGSRRRSLRPTTVNGPYRAGATWGPKPRPSAWAGRTSPTGSLRGESLWLGIALPDSTSVLPCLCQRPRNPSPGLSPPSPRGRATWPSDLAERLGRATWRSGLAE